MYNLQPPVFQLMYNLQPPVFQLMYNLQLPVFQLMYNLQPPVFQLMYNLQPPVFQLMHNLQPNTTCSGIGASRPVLLIEYGAYTGHLALHRFYLFSRIGLQTPICWLPIAGRLKPAHQRSPK
jgi:hypothetical protein